MKKTNTDGLLVIKIEYIPELSFDAQGLLTRMVNLPECDYISAKSLHELCPADSIETVYAALEELLRENYIYKSEDNRYAVNKKMVFQKMRYITKDEIEGNWLVRSKREKERANV